MKKGLLLLCLGVIIGYALSYHKTTPNKQEETTNQSATPKPLDYLITLDMPKGHLDVLINQEEVYFQPFEVASTAYPSISVKKAAYPKLFEQGVANSSWITASKLQKGSQSYVLLSNNQPSHGAFVPAFELLVDPTTKDMREYVEDKTQVIKYVQSNVPQKSESGSCWATSIATPSNDKAWRCSSGNYIYDPCFDVGNNKVVCEPNPNDDKSGLTLNLTESLPSDNGRPKPEESHPWIYELGNNVMCYALTGTAESLDGKLYYYACDNKALMEGNETISKADTIWLTNVVYANKDLKVAKKEVLQILKVWQ